VLVALTFRDYQTEGIERTMAAHAAGVRRPAGVLPTGTGKTIVFSGLIDRGHALGVYGERQLIIAHRDELIVQAWKKVRDVAPHLRVGIVKADTNEVRADVVVASVQTLRNLNRRNQIKNVGLVVVDECHHATAPTYRAVLDHYGCFEPAGSPGAYALGVTATMMRADSGALGEIWQSVAFRRGVAEMIRRGFLVQPRGKRIEIDKLDLDAVKMSAGDFADKALGDALEGAMAPEAIARAYREHAADLPGILFAPTVRTAELCAAALADGGFRVATVTGTTPIADRRQIFADFEAGKIQIISNCGVCTEGTDLPRAQVCVVARPTKSAGLYVQMVGRVLRPYPGKNYALVLDVTGASQKHSLITTVELDGERRKLATEGVADELLTLMDSGSAQVDADGDFFVDGTLRTTEIDLFHGSGLVWMQTKAGVWFIKGDKRYIVVLPGERAGTWDVAWLAEHHRGESDWIIRGQSDQGYAMAYAEGALVDDERRANRRRRQDWKREEITGAQRDLMHRLGVPPPPGIRLTKGEASHLIDTTIASRRIDSPLPMYARRYDNA
jgi:superfamily II DNA or RNA helicase